MIRPAALVALLTALGCGVNCGPDKAGTRPNIVLVTVDTLRADHLGSYGSRTVRTPAMDRLAEQGVLFERSYSQTNVTVPSHLSIFSSLPVSAHGVTSNEQGRVPHPVDVLPELLAHSGYKTAAFVSAAHVGPKGPLAPLLKSFAAWDAPGVFRRAEETNSRVFPWLRKACRDPFFVWIHYWDPHMPYTPPEPFDGEYYTGDPRDPRHAGLENVALKWYFYDLDHIRSALAPNARDVRQLKRRLDANGAAVQDLVLHPERLALPADDSRKPEIRRQLTQLGGKLRRRLPYRRHLAGFLTGIRDVGYPVAQYAGEVTYVDREIGNLRNELERLEVQNRTVLVVTADHGESLTEHGIYFDHLGLYEPTVRVPLIWWAPGRLTPARRTDLARGLDLTPTLMRLAGLEVPAQMQGRDLFAPGGRDLPAVVEASHGNQLMVVDGRWKLIRTLQDFYYFDAYTRDVGATELYDLTDDPAEKTDLAERHAEVARDLGTRLDGWLAAHANGGGNDSGVLSQERRDVLRALGYVQ